MRTKVRIAVTFALAGTLSLSQAETPEQAADVLAQFGQDLAKEKKYTADQVRQIEEMSKKSIINPKFVQQNVVLSTGINAKTLKPVVLNAATGEELKSCGEVKISTGGTTPATGCIQLVDPPEAVKNAMALTQPIDGKITKNGVEKPAKYIVSVNVLYEGSNCETVIIDGVGVEICWPSYP